MPVGKFLERLPTGCIYLIQLLFPPSCVLVCWCVGLCVHWGLAVSNHQRGTDFAPCDVSGGPYLRAPSRSARVRNRFAFVVLGVICPPIARGKFKPELEFQAGTSSFHARTIYDNIGYVDLPEDHMYNTRYV